jgi:hypothetical protein
MYRIAREAYRGLPPKEHEHKPDIIAVRISNVRVRPNQPPISSERDCLWIECKAPDADRPYQWNDVLDEAKDRLAFAHGSRMVYLILAAGLKWMIFRWDPVTPPTMPPLQIIKHDQQGTWPVDPRIRPMVGEPYISAGQNGQCFIDTKRAHSLDFWTTTPNSQIPVNWVSMQSLEQHFAAIRGTAFQGLNPASFA